jgi:glutamate-5-semialdehyde dehydrogenase
MSADLEQLVTGIARRARAAALVLANVSTEAKNAAILRLADLIDSGHDEIIEANRRDIDAAATNELPVSQIDRLALDPKRLKKLAISVREVAQLPDPIGEVLEDWTRPNGLQLRRVRVPIGVIGVIYEARPNVTIDCAVLCLKSGNAAILRGGSEIFHTNTVLAALVARALDETLPAEAFAAAGSRAGDAVQLIPTTERSALTFLLKLNSLVHCIIPRGGEGLIRFVTENSTIPVVKHYTGVCFVYIDAKAEASMAEKLLINAKVQRPGVCNAAEQLLVHAAIADSLLPRLGRAMAERKVELRCDPSSAAILARAGVPHRTAQPSDFTAEFLDLILAIRIVDSLESAVAVINRDGSAHSDAIVTDDETAARRFLAGVDSAAVFWNASTRFHDGFEFGFGAEIGISTDRLHARGPMGLRELCSYKFLVIGDGQVRE